MGRIETSPPEFTPDYEFRMAISGLSWAVGFIEGIGQGTDNYAARTLSKLSEPPRFIVPGTEPDR